MLTVRHLDSNSFCFRQGFNDYECYETGEKRRAVEQGCTEQRMVKQRQKKDPPIMLHLYRTKPIRKLKRKGQANI